MHLIAAKVSAHTAIPWLADFRDPCTNIDFYKDLRLTAWADRRHRELEKRVLSGATAVTEISSAMAEDLHRRVPRSYDVITNGFDPDDLQLPSEILTDRKFSIAHIGTLSASRNPLTLWSALNEIAAENPSFAADLEIKLVGKVDFSILRSAEEAGLTKYLRRIEYMPHDQVVVCQRQSQVLLLVINNTPNAGMILTGKFFEYLAAGRPILCLGPEEGDAAAILRETRAGLLAGFGDTTTMKQHILDLYSGFRKGTLASRSSGTARYSRKELTREMAAVLGRIAP